MYVYVVNILWAHNIILPETPNARMAVTVFDQWRYQNGRAFAGECAAFAVLAARGYIIFTCVSCFSLVLFGYICAFPMNRQLTVMCDFVQTNYE